MKVLALSRIGNPGRCGLVGLLLLVVLASASAQEAPRPGLDAPQLRIAVAPFRAIGAEASLAQQITNSLRAALVGHAQLQVVSGAEIDRAVTAAEADLLALKPGVARALGDKLGVDAVVYGRLVGDVGSLVDDPLPTSGLLAQLHVVETLTLEGQVFPSAAFPLTAGTDPTADLFAATLELLPALGRVLSVIESPEGSTIQLFPLGGRVLAPSTEYGVYEAVSYRAGGDATARSQALARQDLRPGPLKGRLRTAAASDDHAITATVVTPGLRVSAGQLVGLPPLPGSKQQGLSLPGMIVDCDSGEAVVLAAGKLAGVTPVSLTLAPSVKTTVQVLKKDCQPAGVEVTAAATDAVAVSLAVKQLAPFGSLQVTTTPVGASATLDGNPIGTTPLKLEEVAAGDHRLVLSLEGYRPLQQAVTVRRQRPTTLNLSFQKDLKRVLIASDPAGARVSVDGQEVGVSPVELQEVQAGVHELQLLLSGYSVEKQELRVTPEQELQTFRFRLRQLAGNLRVETTPPGAVVTLDGVEKGKSPLALTGLGIGQHQLNLALDGFLPVAKTVEVSDQQTTAVQEALTRAEGRIVCLSVPAGAKILLDGREVGVTPLTLEDVPVGKRLISLTLEGYLPWSARVPVIHGQATKVEVGLLRGTQAGPNK